MRIGFVIKGMTHFKMLGSLIEAANDTSGFLPILLCFDGPYSKKYDKVNLSRIPKPFDKMRKKRFANTQELPALLSAWKINWLVGLTLPTKYNEILKQLSQAGIKTCSIPNFTDGFWANRVSAKDIARINLMCYHSKYALSFHKKYLPLNDLSNCVVTGAPLMDSAQTLNAKESDNVVVMLPNIRKAHYKTCFGGMDRFISIIDNVYRATKAKNMTLIAKSRKKQWHPPEVHKYFSKIIYDYDYYPGTSLTTINRAKNVICFNSSSVFESFVCKKFCINIHMSLGYSIGSKSNGFWQYYKSGVYDFPGVVKTIRGHNKEEIEQLLGEKIDLSAHEKYGNKFCHINDNSKLILQEMLNR